MTVIPHQRRLSTQCPKASALSILRAPHYRSCHSPPGSPAQGLQVCAICQGYLALLRSLLSIEVLNREIHDARDNLFKSSSDGPLSATKPLALPNELPSGSRVNLRRATTAYPERKEKRPLKTYGSKTSQDDSRIHRSSDPDVQNHSSLPSTIGSSNPHNDRTGESTERGDGDGFINGLLHEAGQGAKPDAGHDFRQQGAYDTALISSHSTTRRSVEPLSRGHDNVPEKFDESTMPLTPDETVASRESPARSTLSRLPYSSNHVLSPSMSKGSLVRPQEASSPDPIDTNSKKRPRFVLDIQDPGTAENLPAPGDWSEFPSKRARTDAIEESSNQPNQNDTYDELSLSVSIQQLKNTKSKQSKTERLREADELDDDKPVSDDIDIDLPVENYQPRPSRSRSGRQGGELLVPVDFSKRPETMAKRNRKSKRRKTTAFEQLVREDTDEGDVLPIKASSKDSEPITEVLKPRDIQSKKFSDAGDPEPEVKTPKEISRALPSKKRGRPKKQVLEPQDELTTSTCNPSSPVKSNRAMSSGPPPKQPKEPVALDSELSSADEDFPLPTETNPIIPLPPCAPRSSLPPKLLPNPRSPSPTKPDPQPSSPLQTPPKTTPAKGPDRHSPISSGKVAYRVGLSKRARIEPLLRIVRK